MDADVPKRSKLWLEQSLNVKKPLVLFDRVTLVFVVFVLLSSFIIFWPIVSKINFEEAFFTPLAPFLIFLLGFLGISANDSMRILFILSFMLSTFGIYLLVRDLTKRHMTAIIAAVSFLVPPIPIFVLTYLRQGLLETELASARSFFTIIYGDGAHFLALALIPFAILFFLRYLKRDEPSYFLMTAITSALIILANRTQALNLALILAICFVTEAFLGMAREKSRKFFLVCILTYGLVSFWYTPEFLWESVNALVDFGAENFKYFFPLPFLLTIFTLLFSFVYLARREDRQPIFISFFVFAIFMAIVLSWFLTGKSYTIHPHRQLSVLNMFGAIVLALCVCAFLDGLKLDRMLGIFKWSASVKALAALGLGIVSFILLSIIIYTLSPLFIVLVAGPYGFWTRIRSGVILDRQDTLSAAGGDFKLVATGSGEQQFILGVAISLITLLVVAYLMFVGRPKSKDSDV